MADGQVGKLSLPSWWLGSQSREPPGRASRHVAVCVMQAREFSNSNSEKRLAEEVAEISTKQKAGKCPWGQPERLCHEDPVG